MYCDKKKTHTWQVPTSYSVTGNYRAKKIPGIDLRRFSQNDINYFPLRVYREKKSAYLVPGTYLPSIPLRVITGRKKKNPPSDTIALPVVSGTGSGTVPDL